jgi:hypothetical protein
MDLVDMGRGFRLLARVASVIVSIPWVAFLIEHVRWFFEGTPPPRIWWAEGAHVLIIAGLLAGLRWPVAGSLLVIAGIAGFQFFTDATSALGLFLMTAAPAVLFFGAWLSDRSRQQRLV